MPFFSAKGLPFLALYTGQTKDPAQKINSYVALMRIRDRHTKGASDHKRVLAFLIGTLKTECP